MKILFLGLGLIGLNVFYREVHHNDDDINDDDDDDDYDDDDDNISWLIYKLSD